MPSSFTEKFNKLRVICHYAFRYYMDVLEAKKQYSFLQIENCTTY